MPIMNTTEGARAIDWEALGNGRYRLQGRGINAVVSHKWNGKEWTTELVSGHIPMDGDSLHQWCAWNLG